VRRAAIKRYMRFLEVVSVVAGLLIVGSCATLGFFSGGFWGGLVGLAVTLLVAVALVGMVFLITTMSDDVMAIRRYLDSKETPSHETRSATAGEPADPQGSGRP